jgi:hypothetical protein
MYTCIVCKNRNNNNNNNNNNYNNNNNNNDNALGTKVCQMTIGIMSTYPQRGTNIQLVYGARFGQKVESLSRC